MNQTVKPLNLLKKYWWVFLVIVIVLLLVILVSLSWGLDWSNWAISDKSPGLGAITLWGRSLWDWAGLLLVPLVLAIGGFWFQRSEKESDRKIAKEARMDKTLDEYLKAMENLLLKENSLLKSKKDEPIRDVARTQTITVIKRLDTERNRIVFHFLQEANLVSTRKGDGSKKVKKPIISLARADLIFADLREANLEEVNLQEAYLEESNLLGANLKRANLKWAGLKEANLKWAGLKEANLVEANLHGANLEWAELKGANLKRAYLKEANLKRAELQGAELQGANLQEANLQGANLQGANLQGANLQGADLQGTIFVDISSMVEGYREGTIMPDGTKFSESTDVNKFTEPTEEE